MSDFLSFLNNIDVSRDIMEQLEKRITDFPVSEKRIYSGFYRKLSDIDKSIFPTLEVLEKKINEKNSDINTLKVSINDDLVPEILPFVFYNEIRDSTEIFLKPETKTIFDGPDIFNDSIISLNVPYICYHDTEDHYHKILPGQTKLENFIVKQNEKWKDFKNSIMMIIWLNPEKITNNNTIFVTWTLYDNIIDYKFSGEVDPIDIIRNTLNIKIEKVVINSQDWTMNMKLPTEPLLVHPNVLAHIITNHKLLTEHYIDEYEKPFDQKKIMKFHYINSKNDNTSINVKQGKDYIKLGCVDVPDINLLKKDLIYLLSVYIAQEKTIIKEYGKFNIKFILPELDIDERVGSKPIDQLQLWGRQNQVTIFDASNNYATKCQGDRKPVITDEPENNETVVKFDLKNVNGEPVSLNMKCNNPDSKYPGMNKEKVPCCFKNIQFEKTTKKKATEKTTSGFLEPDEYGNTYSNLDFMFGKLKRKGVGGKIGKSNINYSPNNLTMIFCILEFFEIKEEPGRVMKILRSESKSNPIYPYLYFQEMYDSSAEEIYQLLTDPDVLIDSRWIRGLETVFDINIFIFEEKNKKLEFEIPRHKNGYIKVRNQKESILVYKNRGSNAEQLKGEIRFELLLPEKEIKTDILFAAFENYLESYIIKKGSVEKSFLQEINYPELFEITAQSIDEFGKLSSVLTENGFVVQCLPSAPLNLPLFNKGLIPTESDVTEFFTEKYSERNEDGLWYDIGMVKKALFVPLKEKEVSVVSELSEFKKIKRNSEIVLFLLRWCLFPDPDKMDLHRDYFIEKENFLDFSKIKRKLPDIASLSDKIKYLKTTGMTNGTKFTLSKKFIDKAMIFLKKWIPLKPDIIDSIWEYKDIKEEIYIPIKIWLPDFEKYNFKIEQYLSMKEREDMNIYPYLLKESNVPYIIDYQGNFMLVRPVETIESGIMISMNWTGTRSGHEYILYKGSLDKIDSAHTSGNHHIVEMDGHDKYYVLLPL